MNQYDKCQLAQKWFLVCWVITEASTIHLHLCSSLGLGYDAWAILMHIVGLKILNKLFRVKCVQHHRLLTVLNLCALTLSHGTIFMYCRDMLSEKLFILKMPLLSE